jgi:ATP-dependent DNA ligase
MRVGFCGTPVRREIGNVSSLKLRLATFIMMIHNDLSLWRGQRCYLCESVQGFEQLKVLVLTMFGRQSSQLSGTLFGPLSHRKAGMTKRAGAKIAFIESMECLSVEKLPDGPDWSYEIKLDGYRLECVKTAGKVTLYSRLGNVLNRKFPYIATALDKLPDDTVLGGELVALNAEGRSDFNLLQNFRSAESQIHFYAFDVLTFKGKDLMHLPLSERRSILSKIVPENNHVSLSAVSNGSASQMLAFAREHRLEGVIAKKLGSLTSRENAPVCG